jgi:hypothetical protein
MIVFSAGEKFNIEEESGVVVDNPADLVSIL